MIGLLCFVLAVLASPFKSKLRLEAENAMGWHRAGFRCYWRWKSRPQGGRPQIDTELRVLIRVVNQQDIGQRNTINIPHLALRSVLCRNIVGEKLLCRFWRMGLEWFGNASREDALAFVF